MIPRTLTLGARDYALTFTARSLVRAQEVLLAPFESLFEAGAPGLAALLYAALLEHQPRATLSLAAALTEQAVRLDALPRLRDCVLSAFADSGFERTGVPREALTRLMEAAARAGYPHPEQLEGMALCEIHRALESHLNALRLSLRLPPAPPVMSDEGMQEALLNLARRLNNEHT